MNNAKELISILHNKGHSAYLVGGCVRDIIMGRTPHDYDICTSATPDEMLEIFKDFKVIETGLKHGTLTVMYNNKPYEITTYRIDGEYKDNRRPESVEFTTDLIKDLSRRDFTINAIAYNDNEGYIDPFNGIKDIENKTIRCVGEPNDRFNEDALRILRAIRFSAQLGFNIEFYTRCYIFKNKSLLSNISAERINSEFCKIIMSDNISVSLFNYIDVFSVFLTELSKYYELRPDLFRRTVDFLKASGNCDLITKLAILFNDLKYLNFYDKNFDELFGKSYHVKQDMSIIESLMKRLRFNNNTISSVCELIKYNFSYNIHNDSFSIKQALNKIGLEQFNRLLFIRNLHTDNHRYLRDVKEKLDYIVQNHECYCLKDLQINGNDLKRLGFSEGKQIGDILKCTLEYVMWDNSKNTKDKLIKYVKTGYCQEE